MQLANEYMSIWNFRLFETIFGKNMFTGGGQKYQYASSHHNLLLSSVENPVSRKVSFKALNILLCLTPTAHLVQQVVVAGEALLVEMG